MRCDVLRALILLAVLLSAIGAQAHEVRPAYLEIAQTPQQGYAVLWKQPVMGEVAVRLVPHLSSGWLARPPVTFTATPRFLIKTWTIESPTESLDGQTLEIEGLERTITDVLVRIIMADGTVIQERLDPRRPAMDLKLRSGKTPPVPQYLKLGIEHILMGVDHLMFVLGLLLLVGSAWGMVKTVTAFTVAHSLTLAATIFGFMQVHLPLIEALVALSIVFVAVELVHRYRGRRYLTLRRPWIIAFCFGLLHGAAFAGALAEIGLPPEAVLMSLFLFNAGVEIGQLLFVAAVLVLICILRRFEHALPVWGRWVPPYAIGSFAAFWFIERLMVVVR